MDFPTIHTNFWDAVIAVPSVMIITQMIKMLLKVPKKFIPTIALIIGLVFSIFISHRESSLREYLWDGFMAMQQLEVMPH